MRLSDAQLDHATKVGLILSHRLRIEILAAVGRRGEASSTSLSRQDKLCTVGLVNYHLRRLFQVEALRADHVVQVGPVAEHFYALTSLGQSMLVLVADLSRA